MVSLRKTISIMVVASCLAARGFTQAPFKAPRAESVTDAYVPYQVVYDGFVVLELFLTEDGAIVEERALRDPGAMVPAAVASVAGWKFRAAETAGRAVPSAMIVPFVYRPRNNGPAPVRPPQNFKPVVPDPAMHTSGTLDYVPAGIVSVAYPDYPVNSVAWGSVVVQVTVNTEGKSESPQVLYGEAPFKDLALNTLQSWRLTPATLGGKAISSQMLVAFIFQPPVPSL